MGSETCEPREVLVPAAVPPIAAESLSKVAVVVAVHNEARIAVPCLRALHERTPTEVRLVVVDDASDAHTERRLVDEVKRMDRRPVALLRNETNLRYTRSISRGMDQAYGEFGCEWAICLNSDVLVTPGWLERLIAAAGTDGSIVMVGAYLSRVGNGNPANPAQIDPPPGASYLESAERIAALATRPPPDAVIPVGACIALRKDAWREHGPFDPGIGSGGGYGEECDLWAKVTKAGKRAVFAADVWLYHESHATYGEAASQAEMDGYRDFISRHRAHYEARLELASRQDPRREIARRVRNLRVEHDRPRLMFFFEGLELCGGVLAPLTICDALLERGIETGIAYRMDMHNARRHMPGRCGFMQVASPSEWLRSGGPERCIVSGTDWRTGRFVAELARLQRGVRPMAFVQDREDWFRDKNGNVALDDPAMFAPYLDIARERCVVNSQWVAASLMRDHRFGGDRMRWVGIPVNTDLFYDRGLRGEKVRVLSMCRPSTPRRGEHLLALTYRRLREKYGDRIELCTYGDYPEIEMPTKHIGKLPQKRLAVEWAKAHVALEPSTVQAWGMAAHEGMASGCTVVSTANGGISNYARAWDDAKRTGDCLIAPNRPDGTQDAEAFFALACRAVEDAELRSALERNAREAAARFSVDAVADEWAALIKEWWNV